MEQFLIPPPLIFSNFLFQFDFNHLWLMLRPIVGVDFATSATNSFAIGIIALKFDGFQFKFKNKQKSGCHVGCFVMERMRRRSRATTFEGERVALLKCTVTGQWAEFTSDKIGTVSSLIKHLTIFS
jgi:hypothetical protein